MSIDKKSTKYFMTQMTQKEFDELYKFRFTSHDLETGLTKKKRYIFNKIQYDYLEKNQHRK